MFKFHRPRFTPRVVIEFLVEGVKVSYFGNTDHETADINLACLNADPCYLCHRPALVDLQADHDGGPEA